MLEPAAFCLMRASKFFLDKETMFALRQWLEERKKFPNAPVECALWLTKQGDRLKIAGIASVIDRISWQAKLLISVETLRRTWLMRTTSELNKTELAAKVGSYISKATIKRCGLPLS